MSLLSCEISTLSQEPRVNLKAIRESSVGFFHHMWLDPEIVGAFSGKDADNLVVDHLEESEESDDGVDAAFAGSKYIDKV